MILALGKSLAEPQHRVPCVCVTVYNNTWIRRETEFIRVVYKDADEQIRIARTSQRLRPEFSILAVGAHFRGSKG